MPASDNLYKSLRDTIPDVPFNTYDETPNLYRFRMYRCWLGDCLELTRQYAISQLGLSQIPWQVWKERCHLHLWLSWPLLAITMVMVYYDIQQSNYSLIGIMVYYRPICLRVSPAPPRPAPLHMSSCVPERYFTYPIMKWVAIPWSRDRVSG